MNKKGVIIKKRKDFKAFNERKNVWWDRRVEIQGYFRWINNGKPVPRKINYNRPKWNYKR